MTSGTDRLLSAIDRLLLVEARATRARRRAALERLLERRMKRVFALQQAAVLRRLAPLRDAFPSPLREAVDPRELDAAVDGALAATRRVFAGILQRAAEQAVLAGGQRLVGEVGIDTSFTLTNPRAVAFLQDHGAARVTLIDETTRAELQAILVQGVDEGWSYRRTGKRIADYFIGLRTDPPSRAEGTAIRSRARLIAVTETGEAYSQGSLLAAQAIADGGASVEKSWLTAGDARVSELCRGNADAGWIVLADAFPSGHQRPLGHPACRCALLARVQE